MPAGAAWPASRRCCHPGGRARQEPGSEGAAALVCPTTLPQARFQRSGDAVAPPSPGDPSGAAGPRAL